MAKKRERCKCGTCPACLDDARWNRIFEEKFAYPDYYAAPSPLSQRGGSSFTLVEDAVRDMYKRC